MRPEDLGAGKLLVASRDLEDPNFAKCVVLIVQYDEDGVVGLIVNRRSKVPISKVLDDIPEAKNRPDPIYAGGPVEKNGVLALLRAHQKSGVKRVMTDTYLISDKGELEKALAGSTGDKALHIYLGYAGWAPGQLEHEVDLGAWYIFRGDPEMIFDSDPDSLWSRLIHETELRIASVMRTNTASRQSGN